MDKKTNKYVGPFYCGAKCTLAASHAAPWWVTPRAVKELEKAGQTDGRMSDLYITLIARLGQCPV